MQNYENNHKEENFGKKILSEFLGFLKYKVDNDELTTDEVDSLVRSIVACTDLVGTAESLAKFYGQSTHNVQCVVNRRLLRKPVRRVYYPFREFSEVVPASWRKPKNGGGKIAFKILIFM